MQRTWTHLPSLNRRSLRNTVRTTLAAGISLVAARAAGLPEFSWSVITTVVVMQSTVGSAWQVSWQRLLGTLLGGVSAVLLLAFLPPGLFAYSIGMLGMGLLCAFLPQQNSAYRFAGITLAIIMLPSHATLLPVRTIALHRFLEVTLGIIVGMAVTAVWPDRVITAIISPPKTP